MSTTYTLGKLLAETREGRELSVEDVAHQTRISASTLRCLENDDYSQFPNLVYARSFLQLYSRHLEVDASKYLDELKELSRSDLESGGYFSGQFNPHELQEIKSWKNYVPVRPILTALFFIAVGGPAAWWVSTRYIEYQKEANSQTGTASTASAKEPDSGAGDPPDVISVPVTAGGLKEEEKEIAADGDGQDDRPAPPVVPDALKNAPRAGAIADDERKPETGAEEGNTPTEAAVPESESGESPVARASTGRAL